MKLSVKRIKLKSLLALMLIGVASGLLIFYVINQYVKSIGADYIHQNIKDIPTAYTALIPGAKVHRGGRLSSVVYDRVVKGAELYKQRKVKRILVSGDHGNKNYDEVNAMKNYLLKLGIPAKDIFMDHAGFNTYDSMVRAKQIFCIKDMIIVTQKFHLSRAVYIARKNGIKAYGYVADKRKYLYEGRYAVREFLARVKSFGEVLLSLNPEHSGKKIPITGNSKLSWD